MKSDFQNGNGESAINLPKNDRREFITNSARLGLALFGAVGGLITTNNSAYLFQKAPENVRARAYGGLASCIFFGQFISPVITTPMVLAFGLKIQFGIWVAVILCVSLFYAKLRYH